MATARAHANIALVKYWGKRTVHDNVPAAGSLSLTLQGLDTETTVELAPEAGDDALVLDGQPQSGRALARVSRFVDIVRRATGRTERVRVESRNDFPTAAGLASSASAFAALAVAATAAFGATPDRRELSRLARRGSGSAARSIFGGLVKIRGEEPDPYAEPVLGSRLELGAVVCVVRSTPKSVGSTDGMELTRTTSPYHEAWLKLVAVDLDRAETALREADFDALAAIVEGNCLAMHANAFAARPGLVYFEPPTVSLIHRVRGMRADGVPVCFTIDAGPHVVVFTPLSRVDEVAAELRGADGVDEIRSCRPGGDASLVEGRS